MLNPYVDVVVGVFFAIKILAVIAAACKTTFYWSRMILQHQIVPMVSMYLFSKCMNNNSKCCHVDT